MRSGFLAQVPILISEFILFNIPGVMAWPDISLGVAPAKPVHVCARDPVLTVLT